MMISPYPNQRRRDPQPISRGGELALVVVCAALLGACLAALAGLSAASLIAGGGWVWPHDTATAGHVVGGLLAGQPGRGLPPTLTDRVPGPCAVYAAVALAELAFAAAAVTGGFAFARWHRPGDARAGMATRGEAAAVLGMNRLRAAKTIIRPDLYSPHAAAATPAAGHPTGMP